MTARASRIALLSWLAGLVFGVGVVLCVLGMVISFVPGAEQGWFTMAGVLVGAGLFVPRWQVRTAAVLIAVFCAYAAFDGHRRGMEYRQHVEQRHTVQSHAP